jgi:hypothetical protein
MWVAAEMLNADYKPDATVAYNELPITTERASQNMRMHNSKTRADLNSSIDAH